MPRSPRETARPAGQALDLPTIEPKPKRVILDDDFGVHIDLSLRQEADYVRLRGLIATGSALTGFYRASRGVDHLLKSDQVMHLHLGGPGSDAILYLIQYPDHVVFVSIDTHRHLRTAPPGIAISVLGRRKHEAGLRAKAEELKAQLIEAKAKLFLKPKPSPKG